MATPPTTTAVLHHVLADRPDVLGHLDDAHAAAPLATDPELLAICSARIAQLLGGEVDDRLPIAPDLAEALPSWPNDDRFDARVRACLAFTEQYVIDVASLDDQTAFAVVEQMGEEGFGNFVNALLVTEQRQRLRLMWDRLFDGVAP